MMIKKTFNVPYKRYNKNYELELSYDTYRIISINEDGSVLARDVNKKRPPVVFSKEQLDNYNKKEVLMRF